MLIIFIVLMLFCHLFMRHASNGREPHEQRNNTLSPTRFGFAFGATCVIVRLGCILTLVRCRGQSNCFTALFTASMSRQSCGKV